MKRIQLAEIDNGHCGTPGSRADEQICKIYRLSTGRYEAIVDAFTGNNQGYYQCNYRYGPWRGRGDTIAQAIEAMLNIVDRNDDWRDRIRQAAQEARYGAEDAEEANRDSKRLRQVRDALNKCKDTETIEKIANILNV